MVLKQCCRATEGRAIWTWGRRPPEQSVGQTERKGVSLWAPKKTWATGLWNQMKGGETEKRWKTERLRSEEAYNRPTERHVFRVQGAGWATVHSTAVVSFSHTHTHTQFTHTIDKQTQVTEMLGCDVSQWGTFPWTVSSFPDLRGDCFRSSARTTSDLLTGYFGFRLFLDVELCGRCRPHMWIWAAVDKSTFVHFDLDDNNNKNTRSWKPVMHVVHSEPVGL